MNRGSYLLILKLLKKVDLKFGRNFHEFEEGFYIYVGSAMNSLTGRVGYHLSNDKKGRWHIDRLLEFAEIEYIVMLPAEERLEEKISNILEKDRHLEVIRKFGSSDVKTRGNLFFVKDEGFFEKIFEILSEVKR